MNPEDSHAEFEAYLIEQMRTHRPDISNTEARELVAEITGSVRDSDEDRRYFLESFRRGVERGEADRRANAEMAKAAKATNDWIAENHALGGVCDFCASQLSPGEEHTWTTDVPLHASFAGLFEYGDTTETGAAELPMHYDPDWAACDRCDPVAALRSPERLADHILKHRDSPRIADIHLEEYEAEFRQSLVALYTAFFARAHRKETPLSTDPIGRDQFYGMAMSDAMDDEMNFAISRGTNQDPDRTFSLEAYEALGYQMHDFLMARTVAYQNRNHVMPRSMRAELRIIWDEDTSEEALETLGPPWYAVSKESGGPGIPANGEVRVSTLRFLRERRARYEQGKQRPDVR